MLATVSYEESVIVEQGIAPILWVAYLQSLSSKIMTRKNLIRSAEAFLESNETIPESVIIESNILIERMEYENSCMFNQIMADFCPETNKDLKRLGMTIGLASIGIHEFSSLQDRYSVPKVELSEAFLIEDIDPYIDMFAAHQHLGTTYQIT